MSAPAPRTRATCPECGETDAHASSCSRSLATEIVGPPTDPDGATVVTHPHPTAGLPTGDVVEIPGYQILGELARGGMGVVYRARQAELGREVALKVVIPGRDVSAEVVERFRREAQAAARLHHPGIVPVHDLGHVAGVDYFTMELIEGRTLAEAMAAADFDLRGGLRWLAEVCDAVHYAHLNGVLHRDLKPANVLLRAGEQPVVTDFGLAKDQQQQDLTRSADVMGTPAYMPPEQVRGARVDARADVYALGVMLYQMASGGQLPHRANGLMALLTQISDGAPTPLRAHVADVDPDLETLIETATARAADDRYPSAEALAAELRRYLAGEPLQARPLGRLERARRTYRANRLVANLALAVAALLVIGLGATLFTLYVPARVQLSLKAPQATVWANGVEHAWSPGQTLWLTPGATLLRVRAAGHQPVERQLQLAAGRSRALQLELTPDHGWLVLTRDPADAQLTIDGAPTPGEPRLRLPIGLHVVRASRDDHVASERAVEILPGRETPLELTLARRRGSLTVRCEPAGAQLELQHLERPALRRQLRVPIESAALAVGRWRGRLSSPGYFTRELAVQIGTQPTRLALRLAPRSRELLELPGLVGRVLHEDLDGDGEPELACATTAGVVVARPRGEDVWRHQLDEPCYGLLGAAELTGDGVRDLLVDLGHAVAAYDGRDGRQLWRCALEGGLRPGAALCLADLSGDRRPELLLARGGELLCLDAVTGTVRWRHALARGEQAVDIAAVRGDARPMVVATARRLVRDPTGPMPNQAGGRVLLLDAAGAVLGTRALSGAGALAVRREGAAETVLVGHHAGVDRLELRDGEPRLSRLLSSPRPVDHVISVDLDGDGRPDVLAAGRRRVWWAAAGTPAARPIGPPLSDGSDRLLATLDVDGDGRREVLCWRPGRATTWTPEGRVVSDAACPAGSCWLLADLDGSGRPQLLMRTKRGVSSVDVTPQAPGTPIMRPAARHVISLDLDPDGGLPHLIWCRPDGIECRRLPATRTAWRVPHPGVPLSLIAAGPDLDGDGLRDVLLGSGERLLALSSASGRALGEQPLPGHPIWCDVVGDSVLALVEHGPQLRLVRLPWGAAPRWLRPLFAGQRHPVRLAEPLLDRRAGRLWLATPTQLIAIDLGNGEIRWTTDARCYPRWPFPIVSLATENDLQAPYGGLKREGLAAAPLQRSAQLFATSYSQRGLEHPALRSSGSIRSLLASSLRQFGAHRQRAFLESIRLTLERVVQLRRARDGGDLIWAVGRRLMRVDATSGARRSATAIASGVLDLAVVEARPDQPHVVVVLDRAGVLWRVRGQQASPLLHGFGRPHLGDLRVSHINRLRFRLAHLDGRPGAVDAVRTADGGLSMLVQTPRPTWVELTADGRLGLATLPGANRPSRRPLSRRPTFVEASGATAWIAPRETTRYGHLLRWGALLVAGDEPRALIHGEAGVWWCPRPRLARRVGRWSRTTDSQQEAALGGELARLRARTDSCQLSREREARWTHAALKLSRGRPTEERDLRRAMALAYAQGQHQRAVDLARRLVALGQGDFRVHHAMWVAARAGANGELAQQALERLLGLSLDQLDRAHWAARFDPIENRLWNAALLERATAEQARLAALSADDRARLALRWLLLQKPARALPIVVELTRGERPRGVWLALRGLARLRTGDVDGARADGAALARLRRAPIGLAPLTREQERADESAAGAAARASDRAALARHDSAVALLLERAGASGRAQAAVIALTHGLLTLGRARARTALDAALRARPDDPALLAGRAMFGLLTGAAGAAGLLDRAISKSRQPDLRLIEARAQVHLRARRFDAALKDLDVLLELAPFDVPLRALRAQLHLQQGRRDLAAEDFYRGLEHADRAGWRALEKRLAALGH